MLKKNDARHISPLLPLTFELHVRFLHMAQQLLAAGTPLSRAKELGSRRSGVGPTGSGDVRDPFLGCTLQSYSLLLV